MKKTKVIPNCIGHILVDETDNEQENNCMHKTSDEHYKDSKAQ